MKARGEKAKVKSKNEKVSKKVKGKIKLKQEKKPKDIKERTFTFALKLICFVQKHDDRHGVWRILGRQALRSGTSIGANVEEAQAGQSRADFNSKYAIALKEARETIYWLRLLKESGLTPDQNCDALIKEAGEISRIIGAIIVKSKKGQNG